MYPIEWQSLSQRPRAILLVGFAIVAGLMAGETETTQSETHKACNCPGKQNDCQPPPPITRRPTPAVEILGFPSSVAPGSKGEYSVQFFVRSKHSASLPITTTWVGDQSSKDEKSVRKGEWVGTLNNAQYKFVSIALGNSSGHAEQGVLEFRTGSRVIDAVHLQLTAPKTAPQVLETLPQSVSIGPDKQTYTVDFFVSRSQANNLKVKAHWFGYDGNDVPIEPKFQSASDAKHFSTTPISLPIRPKSETANETKRGFLTLTLCEESTDVPQTCSPYHTRLDLIPRVPPSDDLILRLGVPSGLGLATLLVAAFLLFDTNNDRKFWFSTPSKCITWNKHDDLLGTFNAGAALTAIITIARAQADIQRIGLTIAEMDIWVIIYSLITGLAILGVTWLKSDGSTPTLAIGSYLILACLALAGTCGQLLFMVRIVQGLRDAESVGNSSVQVITGVVYLIIAIAVFAVLKSTWTFAQAEVSGGSDGSTISEEAEPLASIDRCLARNVLPKSTDNA